MIEGSGSEVENLKDAFRSHVTQVALLRSACLSVADHKPSQSFLAQTKNKTLTTVRVISARIDGHKPLTLVCTSHQTAWQKLAYYNYVEYLADVEPVACPSGELLNSVLLVFEVTDGYSYSQIKARYVYRCCSSLARTVRACADKATGWQAGGWVHYLARHEVSCRDQLNAGLSKMALQRQQSGMIQYAYSCCPAKSTTRCEPRSTSWTRIGSMVHSIGINTRYRSMGMYGIGSESTYQLQLDCNDQLPYLSSFRMELNDEEMAAAAAHRRGNSVYGPCTASVSGQ
ncbi:hypothetical protein BV898_18587 [Hypsibius exemplaris]|uniref:Uncharacterized protein n=1 Tax=Hypsibius exemplaris TaxID=2072580 RepID=A0A9X6RNM5_HYPEX|nr:hypothetical protein BV898_18587 [Hypsibius exemplaris]